MNRRPESELEPPIPPLAPVRPTAPGGTEGDDAALAAWFALLPDRVPQPGFVLRVMSALPRRSWLDSGCEGPTLRCRPWESLLRPTRYLPCGLVVSPWAAVRWPME